MKKTKLLFTAIAICGLATITYAQTVPSYVPTNGLVGWWPFNGNANDESGNGNNGTVNGAALTSDRFNNINTAYSFNGQSDFIQLQNSNSIDSLYDFSVSAWINPNNLNSLFQYIVSKDSDGYAANGDWDFYLKNNQLSFAITSNTPPTYEQQSNSSIQSISWQNVLVTRQSGNGIVKMYVNGILDTSMVGNIGLVYNLQQMVFGKQGSSNQHYFNGKIDDIGIWNRVISQQEITDLYNGCQLSVNTQPSNQQININNYAQFIVGSTDPIATFQWQTDLGVGFQNLNSVGQYSGTTNDTLTVSNVTMSNNNQPFRCIVSSGSCSDTSNVAVLTVNNNVGINENTQDNLFSVFPNPAQSVINVNADSKLIGHVYSIYDNTGRVVLTGKLNSQNTTIELSNLSGGIYMFSVGENMKQTFKVIKE